MTMPNAKPVQAFEPFSWLKDGARKHENRFTEITHDVAKGIVLILDLVVTSEIEEDAMNSGSDCVPILAGEGRETLLLLARAAAQMLRDRSEDAFSCANNSAEAGHGS
jgi:hypothetical protein